MACLVQFTKNSCVIIILMVILLNTLRSSARLIMNRDTFLLIYGLTWALILITRITKISRHRWESRMRQVKLRLVMRLIVIAWAPNRRSVLNRIVVRNGILTLYLVRIARRIPLRYPPKMRRSGWKYGLLNMGTFLLYLSLILHRIIVLVTCLRDLRFCRSYNTLVSNIRAMLSERSVYRTSTLQVIRTRFTFLSRSKQSWQLQGVLLTTRLTKNMRTMDM